MEMKICQPVNIGTRDHRNGTKYITRDKGKMTKYVTEEHLVFDYQ
jgi:hypothetical protein